MNSVTDTNQLVSKGFPNAEATARDPLNHSIQEIARGFFQSLPPLRVSSSTIFWGVVIGVTLAFCLSNPVGWCAVGGVTGGVALGVLGFVAYKALVAAAILTPIAVGAIGSCGLVQRGIDRCLFSKEELKHIKQEIVHTSKNNVKNERIFKQFTEESYVKDLIQKTKIYFRGFIQRIPLDFLKRIQTMRANICLLYDQEKARKIRIGAIKYNFYSKYIGKNFNEEAIRYDYTDYFNKFIYFIHKDKKFRKTDIQEAEEVLKAVSDLSSNNWSRSNLSYEDDDQESIQVRKLFDRINNQTQRGSLVVTKPDITEEDMEIDLEAEFFEPSLEKYKRQPFHAQFVPHLG